MSNKQMSTELINLEMKVSIAANWEERHPIHGFDVNYKAFFDVMMHRKNIAIAYLKAKNETEKQNFIYALDDCNKKIAEILGL